MSMFNQLCVQSALLSATTITRKQAKAMQTRVYDLYENENFPRITKFNSIWQLRDAIITLHDFNIPRDIGYYAVEVFNNTGHLGEVNQQYMLDNLDAVYFFTQVAVLNNEEAHNLYSKALNKIVAINIYKEALELNFNLPSSLSRRQQIMKEHLVSYISQQRQGLKGGSVADA